MKVQRIFKKIEGFSGENQCTDDFYELECLHDAVEDELISGAEEGFMLGYLGL
jgi:hypothetical protein